MDSAPSSPQLRRVLRFPRHQRSQSSEDEIIAPPKQKSPKKKFGSLKLPSRKSRNKNSSVDLPKPDDAEKHYKSRSSIDTTSTQSDYDENEIIDIFEFLRTSNPVATMVEQEQTKQAGQEKEEPASFDGDILDIIRTPVRELIQRSNSNLGRVPSEAANADSAEELDTGMESPNFACADDTAVNISNEVVAEEMDQLINLLEIIKNSPHASKRSTEIREESNDNSAVPTEPMKDQTDECSELIESIKKLKSSLSIEKPGVVQSNQSSTEIAIQEMDDVEVMPSDLNEIPSLILPTPTPHNSFFDDEVCDDIKESQQREQQSTQQINNRSQKMFLFEAHSILQRLLQIGRKKVSKMPHKSGTPVMEQSEGSAPSDFDQIPVHALHTMPNAVILCSMKRDQDPYDDLKDGCDNCNTYTDPIALDREFQLEKDIINTLLKDCIVNYDDMMIIKKLGEGAYANVYLAQVPNHGMCAVKIFKPHTNRLEYLKLFAHEVRCLRKCQEIPFTVKFKGACMFPKCCIVLEYVNGGSLANYLKEHKLTNREILKVSRDIADCVRQLHSLSPPILHRDIHLENILVHLDPTTKKVIRAVLGDFGIAKEKSKKGLQQLTATGHARYRAPEISKRQPYSKKVDSYQFGTCLFELLTGKIIYEGCTDLEVCQMRANGDMPEIPLSVPNKLKKLILRCWNASPKSRPGFKDILKTLDKQTRKLDKSITSSEDQN